MTMNKYIQWLITSSQDPRNTSLALKGVLTVGGSYVLQAVAFACSLAVACVAIDQTFVTQFIDAVVQLAELTLLGVGVVLTLYGLLRKLQSGQWSAAK